MDAMGVATMPKFYDYKDSQSVKLDKIRAAHDKLRNIDPETQPFTWGNSQLVMDQLDLNAETQHLLSEFEAPSDIVWLAHHAGTRDGGFYRALKWLEDSIAAMENPSIVYPPCPNGVIQQKHETLWRAALACAKEWFQNSDIRDGINSEIVKTWCKGMWSMNNDGPLQRRGDTARTVEYRVHPEWLAKCKIQKKS